MGVAWNRLKAPELVILDGQLETATAIELTDCCAIDLFPRCRSPGHCIGQLASGGNPLAALADLVIGDQYVDASFAQVHANAVPGPQNREVAADSRLRARVDD